MYIEFKLPSGAGGMAAGYRNMHLKKRIREWAELHNVTITHWNASSGYRSCFQFARESDYTLFALSWQATSIWDQYEIVNNTDTI